MSNFNIDRKNELIGNAEEILHYLTGMYMDQYRGCMLGQDGENYRMDGFVYYRVISYRRAGSEENVRKQIGEAIRKCANLLFAKDKGLGFFVGSDGRDVELILAVEEGSNVDIAHSLRAEIPELRAEEIRNPEIKWRRRSAWGGVITNIPHVDGSYIDGFIEQLSEFPAAVGLLAFPSTRASSFLSGLQDLKTQIDSLSGYSFTYGSDSRRTVKASFPGLNKLGTYLDKQVEKWSEVNGMWEGCIWFAANTEANADRLGAMLAGALGGQVSGADTPCMYFLTQQNPFQTGIFEVPASEYVQRNFTLPQGLIKSPLETFFTPDDLAALLQFPSYAHLGIDVLTSGKELSALRPFDIGGTTAGELLMGRLSDTGAPFQLRINDLTEHVLVTGATGSGKTNTVMQMVREVAANHIPYCIIEPSKKDYWTLISQDDNLEVYSAGQDAFALKLNPFVPEYGVDIGAHLSSLMYAFSGAFDMEAPTRFALEGLLRHAFKLAGWDTADIFYGQRRKIPQIRDLINLLPQFMEQEIQYGQEVSDNIKGAILNRLNSMSDGIISRIISCSPDESLSGEYLCSKNILLELDDLPIDLKPFITEVVLMKMSQFLRRQDSASSLRNVVVLEEAHNVFPEIAQNQQQTSKSIASEYFSNMLSEIREYGTGLVIADQGATKIHSNAIANTKTKILHAVSSEDDVKITAYAMHLDERRMNYLPEFSVGEALVAVRGRPHVWKVNILGVDRAAPRNTACLLCKHRRMCLYEELSAKIPEFDGALEASVKSATRNSYDMTSWKSVVAWVAPRYNLSGCDEVCLLGYLLDHFTASAGTREKRRILFLYSHMEEGNTYE